jgi:hypothetical protein
VLEKLFSLLVGILQDFRRVRFRCHLAFFAGQQEPHVFLTITNTSRNRDVEITHVWLDLTPPIAAVPPQRPLPKRLRPDEIWETWIPLTAVPAHLHAHVLAHGRMRLSTGRVSRAIPDKDVPFEGYVAGRPADKQSR